MIDTNYITQIQFHKNNGTSKKQCGELLGLSYNTVRKYWDMEGIPQSKVTNQKEIEFINRWSNESNDIDETYSYVLGLYLSNGYIATHKYTKCFRLSQNIKYQNLIQEHINALQRLFNKQPNIVYPKNTNAVDIVVGSRDLDFLFPQGTIEGPKNKHPIILEQWQHRIISKYPKQFIRGMMQTDGCRFLNKNSVRYSFSNASKDICNIMTEICDKEELSYSIYERQTNPSALYTIQFKCASNDYLEQVVGGKS